MAHPAYELDASYGKMSVPVFKIRKNRPSPLGGNRHEVVDLMVMIMLEGQVQDSWLTGENHQILPTETQKNTCYVAALNNEYDCGEDYGLALARDILARHSHIQKATLVIEERPWMRFTTGTKEEHDHVFLKAKDPWKYTCTVVVPRHGQPSFESGVKDICVMKTTQSGFAGFIQDKYTNLVPVSPASKNPDRIMCTELTANWKWEGPPAGGFKAANTRLLQSLLDVWSGPAKGGIYSKSVQETAYRVGCTLLDQHSIKEIELISPNIHHYRSDLEQFGLQNPNVVFQSTDCHTTASGRIRTRLFKKGSGPRAKL